MHKILNSNKNMPNLAKRTPNQLVMPMGATHPDPRCFNLVYKEKASLR